MKSLRGLTLVEILDMSWAEFVLRSIGLKEDEELRMKLIRIPSYEVHKLQYMFSKQKPPSIDKFWKVGDNTPSISEDKVIAMKEAMRQYKLETNG